MVDCSFDLNQWVAGEHFIDSEFSIVVDGDSLVGRI